MGGDAPIFACGRICGRNEGESSSTDASQDIAASDRSLSRATRFFTQLLDEVDNITNESRFTHGVAGAQQHRPLLGFVLGHIHDGLKVRARTPTIAASSTDELRAVRILRSTALFSLAFAGSYGANGWEDEEGDEPLPAPLRQYLANLSAVDARRSRGRRDHRAANYTAQTAQSPDQQPAVH